MITNVIHVLPSYPRFTLSSAFYSHIRVLPSHPRFTLISVFYPLVRPSVRTSVRASVRTSVRQSVRIRVLPLPVSLGDLNVLHCFDWRTELWVCAERRFGTTGFYNPHSLPANSTMPFAVTYFNLQQLIFICSNLLLFAATYFYLQQVMLICSN